MATIQKLQFQTCRYVSVPAHSSVLKSRSCCATGHWLRGILVARFTCVVSLPSVFFAMFVYVTRSRFPSCRCRHEFVMSMNHHLSYWVKHPWASASKTEVWHLKIRVSPPREPRTRQDVVAYRLGVTYVLNVTCIRIFMSCVEWFLHMLVFFKSILEVSQHDRTPRCAWMSVVSSF